MNNERHAVRFHGFLSHDARGALEEIGAVVQGGGSFHVAGPGGATFGESDQHTVNLEAATPETAVEAVSEALSRHGCSGFESA